MIYGGLCCLTQDVDTINLRGILTQDVDTINLRGNLTHDVDTINLLLLKGKEI